MRKVELSMNEDYKYQIIKELSDHDGNIYSAAVKLNCSVRTVYRYITKYKTNGKAAFIHKNKHRKPVNSRPQELTETIIRLYKDKYYDCNFCHFQDLLEEREDIRISYASLYDLMTANDFSSPKIQRKTRKERAKKKYLLEHPKIDGKQIEDKLKYQLALEDAHPKQERCKYFGEEIQMDASSMNWF
jgi:transposase